MQPSTADVDEHAGRWKLPGGLRVRIRLVDQSGERQRQRDKEQRQQKRVAACEQPPRNPRRVAFPVLSMRAGEPGLLADDDPHMKGNHHRQPEEQNRWRPEADRPAEEHQPHGDVHRVTRSPVQPQDDQMAGRIPGRERPFTCHVEVANAPEQQSRADDERDRPDRMEGHIPSEWPHQQQRHAERDEPGQREEREERSCEQGPWSGNGHGRALSIVPAFGSLGRSLWISRKSCHLRVDER